MDSISVPPQPSNRMPLHDTADDFPNIDARCLIFSGTVLSICIRFYIFFGYMAFHEETEMNDLTNLYVKCPRNYPVPFVLLNFLVLLIIPSILAVFFWEDGPIGKEIVVGNFKKCIMLGLSLLAVVISRLVMKKMRYSYCIIVLTVELQGYTNLLLSLKDYSLWDIIIVGSLQISGYQSDERWELVDVYSFFGFDFYVPVPVSIL
ncbi:uncharacterized protein LOC126662284 [Mercurialis annua]|uniref:uncharacterized protein LOC126662284 n=1 Tax=Mercurialis annua TaxID=3986 RepID=UPI0021608813|nr:uncharacterized protein LOC126662284 [Mercurialis annua]